MRPLLIALLCAGATLASCTQVPSAVVNTAEIQSKPSLRGLSRVDAQHAWVSGSGGSVARSADGGLSWELVPPDDTAELDFRDIHAFSWDEAVLMSAGEGTASNLLRTEDGGQSWQLIVTNSAPKGFWDGIAFWDEHRGLLVGDPVDGRLTVMYTTDGGRSWDTLASRSAPQSIEGEFAFAASGTSVALQPGGLAWIATGGTRAKVYRSSDFGQSWQTIDTPIAAASAGAGIFSIAFSNRFHGVIVGGDYLAPEKRHNIAAYTTDGGLSWTAAEEGFEPGGYRSGLTWCNRLMSWIAVGPDGADYSRDGQRWHALETPGFHSVDQGWASGGSGRVGRVLND
ncbi:MAG: oxidoreductase [Planctomycetes bacterium]|nr:oxidoreductase [Planctomycetota bacterium]MCP4770155.1 oxidoreductase [Planctomycetota bacterium]MCP4860697.1 oxidoreductase [Planctomycetota bacterium]